MKTWRIDPYGRGLWRVVEVAPGTPVVVNCGSNKARAEQIVADHTEANALRAALTEAESALDDACDHALQAKGSGMWVMYECIFCENGHSNPSKIEHDATCPVRRLAVLRPDTQGEAT